MLTDDVIEDRLRRHLNESLRPSGDLVTRVVHRHRRRRTAIRALPAAFAAVVVVVVVVAMSATPGAPSTRARVPGSSSPPGILDLASYAFHLPSGYRLRSASRTSCRAIVTIGIPRATRAGAPNRTALPPYGTGAIAAAAASSGGCVSMLLTPPFTPTGATPLPYLHHDRASTSSPVDVGPYPAWLSTQGALRKGLEPPHVATASGPLPYLQLSVEIPLGTGAYRLLDVGSQGISEAALVRMVGEGLSP